MYASAEVDALLSGPVHSTVKARWERKASVDATPSMNLNHMGSLLNQSALAPRTPFADKLNNIQPSPSPANYQQPPSKTPGKTQQPTAGQAKTPGKSLTANIAQQLAQASKTPNHNKYSDRLIPRRDSVDLSINLHNLSLSTAVAGGNTENLNPTNNDNTTEFTKQLANSLFHSDDINSKILSYKQKAPKPQDSHTNTLRVIYTHNQQLQQSASSTPKGRTANTIRYINSTAERILDAPDVIDDYYLNLLDWSCRNIVAVGLGRAVYLWDASNGTIELLCEQHSQDDIITSVSWMHDSTHLAIGTNNAVVQLWNIEQKKQVRAMKGHQSRVGALTWNTHILSSGSRDNTIHHHDVRVAQHLTATLTGHEQEICGLKWSPDGTQLASGSNDNTCRVWEANSTTARYTFNDSVAAVKAVSWCPWQRHTLATGSGTADRKIRLYNTNTGVMTQDIDTGSQVCSLQWAKQEKELVSAHGFSQNQLTVWKFPQMVATHQLTGHTSRVLHTAISPDGQTICSAAADETLRFWKIWDPPAGSQGVRKNSIVNGIPTAPTDERRGVLAINIR